MEEEEKDKPLKYKMMMQYLLAQIFDNSNYLEETLQNIQQKKEKEDPFKEEVKIEKKIEPRPLSFLSKVDDGRFKAVREKALKLENKESSEGIDGN